MKRILSLFALTALWFALGSLSHTTHSSNWIPAGPSVALADSSMKEESPAEEKKETPATEKAEEKTEAKAHHAKAKAMAVHKVDINMASKEDLMKLPGVTDETAEKIVAARPFASKSELLSKKILTAAEYSKVKGKVEVKKQKAATPAK